MLDELEPPARQQAADIFPSARLKIVYTDDVVTLTDQALAEMGPEKSRPARDHYTLFAVARVLAQQDVAPKAEHDQPHSLLAISAAMPFPRRSSHPQSSYSGGGVKANYQFVLRLCHVWDRPQLLSAVHARGGFGPRLRIEQNGIRAN